MVGLYADPAQARRAIEALLQAGVAADSISVLARSRDEAEAIERATGASDELEDATTRRHPLSDIVDWLGRVEGAVVPGFGAVLVSGNLWQDIAPAADSRGAITGALVGLGVDVDEAHRLEHSVQQGELLLVVHGPELNTSSELVQAALDTTA